MEKLDKVTEDMEKRLELVFASKDSPVKLRNAEMNVLKTFEDARDLMNDMMHKTSRDRSALAEVRMQIRTDVGRVSECLERIDGKFSDMNANDQRFTGVKTACEAMQKVLGDGEKRQAKVVSTPQMERLDEVTEAMEARLEAVLAFEDSDDVDLPVAELDLLKTFEDARDIMHNLTTSSDLNTLMEGRAQIRAHMGRMSSCLDRIDGKFSAMNAFDQRIKHLKDSRCAMEQVFLDMDSGAQRKTPQMESLDKVIEAMETRLERVFAVQESPVRLRNAEFDLLKTFEDARDMMKDMAHKPSSDRSTFAGVRTSIGRVLTCIDRMDGKFSDMNANDKRFTDVKTACEAMQKVLDSLDTGDRRRESLKLVVCPDCKVELPFKDMAQHEEQCVTECIHCKDQVLFKNLAQHEEQCPCRRVECSHCKAEVPVKDLAQHEEQCPDRLVECDGCMEKMRQAGLGKHKEESCPCRLVKCTECKAGVMFKDMTQHLLQCLKPVQPEQAAVRTEAISKVAEAGEAAVNMSLDDLVDKFDLGKVELEDAAATTAGEMGASAKQDEAEAALKEEVQRLFDATYQDRPDRDSSGHKPTRLIVVSVQSIEGCHALAASEKYLQTRKQIGELMSKRQDAVFPTLVDDAVVSGATEELDPKVNEKLLFHGADAKHAIAIMTTRVRVPRADQIVHGALYGPAAHFAESASKADQYVTAAAKGRHKGLYPMILNRVTLGSVRTLGMSNVKERFPDEGFKAELLRTTFPRDTQQFSICGDRKNPPAGFKGGFSHYREFCLYNENQSMPVYLVWYRREGESRDEAAVGALASSGQTFEHHMKLEEGFDKRVQLGREGGRTAVLGDISGSMSKSNYMELLRRAFRDLVGKARQENKPVVLGKWDDRVEFKDVPAGVADASVDHWINALNSRGGNNMQNAIEQCMARFPDVNECHVMCDGDVSPFSNTDMWEVFQGRFPRTRFHFIAFGTSADAERMRLMGQIGGGRFTLMT